MTEKMMLEVVFIAMYTTIGVLIKMKTGKGLPWPFHVPRLIVAGAVGWYGFIENDMQMGCGLFFVWAAIFCAYKVWQEASKF